MLTSVCLLWCMGLKQGVGPDDFCGLGIPHTAWRKDSVSGIGYFALFPSVTSCMGDISIPLGNVSSQVQQLTYSNYSPGTGFPEGSQRSKEVSCIPGCQDWKDTARSKRLSNMISLQEETGLSP